MISASDKWDVVAELGNRFGLRILVETGGYHGGTMAYLKDKFDFMLTVEIGDALFEEIRALDIPNCLPLKGDSATVLPKVIRLLDRPALFWLDAHFSGMDTAGYGVPCPVEMELRAILSGKCMDHVVLVDDIGSPGIEEEKIAGIVNEYFGWEMKSYKGIAAIARVGTFG